MWRNGFEAKRLREARENVPPRDYEENPALEAAYRREARRRIEERAAYFAEKMGVDYGRIAIKAAKTRWGSCSAKGNLNFHWKLILMPPAVLDYVVVHELAHRIEMNHSPRFWAPGGADPSGLPGEKKVAEGEGEPGVTGHKKGPVRREVRTGLFMWERPAGRGIAWTGSGYALALARLFSSSAGEMRPMLFDTTCPLRM